MNRCDELAYYLRIFHHAHATGNSVPPHMCARAKELLGEAVAKEDPPPWLPELLEALGQQGGTVHDAIRRVRMLKRLHDDNCELELDR